MPKLDEQISNLQDRLGQLKLRQQRIESRRLAVRAQRERKAETRRRILAGAMVMAKAQRGEIEPEQLLRWLDEELVRADDRKLFGLSPEKSNEAARRQPPPSTRSTGHPNALRQHEREHQVPP